MAWVVMVLIASIALALLTNPLFSTIPQPQQQEGLIPSVVVSETDEMNSPLWSLGAIAFLCIIGTMTLQRQGKQPPRR